MPDESPSTAVTMIVSEPIKTIAAPKPTRSRAPSYGDEGFRENATAHLRYPCLASSEQDCHLGREAAVLLPDERRSRRCRSVRSGDGGRASRRPARRFRAVP